MLDAPKEFLPYRLMDSLITAYFFRQLNPEGVALADYYLIRLRYSQQANLVLHLYYGKCLSDGETDPQPPSEIVDTLYHLVIMHRYGELTDEKNRQAEELLRSEPDLQEALDLLVARRVEDPSLEGDS